MKCKIAILLTCFNRKQFTLQCLKILQQQSGLEEYQCQIFLVDDGNDGTGEAVNAEFEQVTVLKGTGNLYWNGGMRLAWKAAIKSKPDFFLWINDDSFLYPNAISNLLSNYTDLKNKNESVGVVLGSMVDPITKRLTYGGRLKCSTLNPVKIGRVLNIEQAPQKCDFINGNLILIPSSTVEKIGVLSDKFTHSMGDFDYGLRAKKSGLDCWVASGAYGECAVNPIEGSWQDKKIILSERINKMKMITQLPPLNEWRFFLREHGGKFWFLMYFDAWLRSRFPKLWLFVKRKI